MTILDRIQRDIDQGDYALARDRLASHVNSKGYNPELLARLGRISHDMHDLFGAGKYWLLSSAEGEFVDAAIREFARRCGENRDQMVSQLPKTVRLHAIDDYPTHVRARLRHWQLESSILARTKAGIARSRTKEVLISWMIMVPLLILLCFAIACCIVGATQIKSWLF